ncbi:MAG: hypothetical protein CMH62_03705 [Nanoarchaeota archaeon]|nr:hypothetical protein [Nanoarchaeota archaeon]
MSDNGEFKSLESVICDNMKQVFIRVEETGIPTSLVAKLPALNPISFGNRDLHSNTIFYLNVDEITDFYNLEYDRIYSDDEIPEEIKDKLLTNFFLFRKVKRNAIDKKENEGESI